MIVGLLACMARRGHAPAWIKEAEASGKSRDIYLIK